MHHSNAQFSWLQQLWTEGVVRWCLCSRQFGEHNETVLESKKIDSTLLLNLFPLQSQTSSSCERRMAVSGSVWNGHDDLLGVVKGCHLGFPFQMTATLVDLFSIWVHGRTWAFNVHCVHSTFSKVRIGRISQKLGRTQELP